MSINNVHWLGIFYMVIYGGGSKKKNSKCLKYRHSSFNGMLKFLETTFLILLEYPLNYRCNGFALAFIEFPCLDSAWTEINHTLALSFPPLIFWISKTAWAGGWDFLLKTYHNAQFPPGRRGNISESTAPQVFPVSLHVRARVIRFPCEKIYDKRPVNISSPHFEF